jgi:hypothetical protein
MYLMYVDESGDCGLPAEGSPSSHFCLSGLVVHELRWRDTMTQLLGFRHWLKRRYKVYLDDELHAADMINKPSTIAASLQRLAKYERLAIIRHFADEIAALSDVSLINVVVDKRTGHAPNKTRFFVGLGIRCFSDSRTRLVTRTFPARRTQMTAESYFRMRPMGRS